MKNLLLVSIAVFSLLQAGAAHACSEPSPPYCVNIYGLFEDQDEFDQCRRQVENFGQEADYFIQCRNDEAAEIANEALRQAKREADRAVDEAASDRNDD